MSPCALLATRSYQWCYHPSMQVTFDVSSYLIFFIVFVVTVNYLYLHQTLKGVFTKKWQVAQNCNFTEVTLYPVASGLHLSHLNALLLPVCTFLTLCLVASCLYPYHLIPCHLMSVSLSSDVPVPHVCTLSPDSPLCYVCTCNILPFLLRFKNHCL